MPKGKNEFDQSGMSHNVSMSSEVIEESDAPEFDTASLESKSNEVDDKAEVDKNGVHEPYND